MSNEEMQKLIEKDKFLKEGNKEIADQRLFSKNMFKEYHIEQGIDLEKTCYERTMLNIKNHYASFESMDEGVEPMLETDITTDVRKGFVTSMSTTKRALNSYLPFSRVHKKEANRSSLLKLEKSAKDTSVSYLYSEESALETANKADVNKINELKLHLLNIDFSKFKMGTDSEFVESAPKFIDMINTIKGLGKQAFFYMKDDEISEGVIEADRTALLREKMNQAVRMWEYYEARKEVITDFLYGSVRNSELINLSQATSAREKDLYKKVLRYEKAKNLVADYALEDKLSTEAVLAQISENREEVRRLRTNKEDVDQINSGLSDYMYNSENTENKERMLTQALSVSTFSNPKLKKLRNQFTSYLKASFKNASTNAKTLSKTLKGSMIDEASLLSDEEKELFRNIVNTVNSFDGGLVKQENVKEVVYGDIEHQWYEGSVPVKGDPLFPDVPQPINISQRTVKDCYLMASLASLAQADPKLITDRLVDNNDGTVTVKFVNHDGQAKMHENKDFSTLPMNLDENKQLLLQKVFSNYCETSQRNLYDILGADEEDILSFADDEDAIANKKVEERKDTIIKSLKSNNADFYQALSERILGLSIDDENEDIRAIARAVNDAINEYARKQTDNESDDNSEHSDRDLFVAIIDAITANQTLSDTFVNLIDSVEVEKYVDVPEYVTVEKSIPRILWKIDAYAADCLWAQMIEKAYALRYRGGSYGGLKLGQSSDVLEHFIGYDYNTKGHGNSFASAVGLKEMSFDLSEGKIARFYGLTEGEVGQIPVLEKPQVSSAVASMNKTYIVSCVGENDESMMLDIDKKILDKVVCGMMEGEDIDTFEPSTEEVFAQYFDAFDAYKATSEYKPGKIKYLERQLETYAKNYLSDIVKLSIASVKFSLAKEHKGEQLLETNADKCILTNLDGDFIAQYSENNENRELIIQKNLLESIIDEEKKALRENDYQGGQYNAKIETVVSKYLKRVTISGQARVACENKLKFVLENMYELEYGAEYSESTERANRLYDFLQQELGNHHAVVVGISSNYYKNKERDKNYTKYGLRPGHAYSVLGVERTQNGIPLVVLRDPYAWFRREYNYNENTDNEEIDGSTRMWLFKSKYGTFKMTLNDFMQTFNSFSGRRV